MLLRELSLLCMRIRTALCRVSRRILSVCIASATSGKIYTLIALCMCIYPAYHTPSITAQTISTAESYLENVSLNYASVRDYIANITITRDQAVMEGTISYVAPNKIRIDFRVPPEQVLVVDEKDLWIYLPEQDIVLQQSIRERQSEFALASEEGLRLLRNNYSVSYLSSPSPTLISGTNESGVHLLLTWNNNREHFRELIIAFNTEGYIRMIRGVTARNKEIRFDFTNIQINQGIPLTRFEYTPPASANLYTDFLFDN